MLRQLSLGSPRLEPSAAGLLPEEEYVRYAVGEDEAVVAAAAVGTADGEEGTRTATGRRSPFRSRRLTTCRKRALGLFQRSASVSSASKSIPNRWLTPTYKDT